MKGDPDIFWKGFQLGAEKEFSELYKSYHRVGDKLDGLKDQVAALERELQDIIEKMPSWASLALKGNHLSVRCYAYYFSNQENITLEEAEKRLIESFNKKE